MDSSTKAWRAKGSDFMTTERPVRSRERLWSRTAMVRPVSVGALLAGGLLYNAWVLELFVPTPLDPRHAYISELYAEGQPYRGLFAALEMAGAACVLVAAAGARSCLPRPSLWAWRCGWWMLAGFALSCIADVLLPMACAPSLDAACHPVHPAHTVTSALSHFFLYASISSHTWAARQQRGQRIDPVGGWGVWLLPATLLSALLTVGPLLGFPGWHGLPQRAHVMLAGTWLIVLAVHLATHPAITSARQLPLQPGRQGQRPTPARREDHRQRRKVVR
ncbi:DUF998 domain-containing protein [Streptomyces luteolus]|uniref:DUF998 domain-containing protein n=1 Tax=Streptomyces luteolus TaxID=3043615 RepID=A0ABT6T1Z4_9ACTN|nr:DUF998 domain-containing protein [Streptomyces sp. B-S-A12]MDI3421666.1 DUF998 domain-containing protein [Streptomyces sp. B-S-A12]